MKGQGETCLGPIRRFFNGKLGSQLFSATHPLVSPKEQERYLRRKRWKVVVAASHRYRCFLFAAPFALLCFVQYSPPSISNTEIDSPFRKIFCKNTVFVSFDDENSQNFPSIADFHKFRLGF